MWDTRVEMTILPLSVGPTASSTSELALAGTGRGEESNRENGREEGEGEKEEDWWGPQGIKWSFYSPV
jgi:hypothetical protein